MKTEKEKMLQGELYLASDPELVHERVVAKNLYYRYNQAHPNHYAEKERILQQLLGKMGSGIEIQAPFYCDYGYNIEVGEKFYANYNTVILDVAKVRFGDHVFIAPNCGFYTAGHPIDAKTRESGLEFGHPITVGDHVWIGAGVQVLPGVTIGSNVVIGAGSVVVHDLPDNCVAVGHPCHPIRRLEPLEALEEN